MSTEREVILVQVNSSDFTNTNGSPQSFRNILPAPIILDKTKEYEVCVYDIQFTNRQSRSTPPLLSIYVNTNLTDGNTIIGSQSTNVVLWISWTHIYTDFTATPALGSEVGTVYFTTEKNRKWYRLASMRQIPFVDISLTLSTGDPIPFNQTKDYTGCTLAIREILK